MSRYCGSQDATALLEAAEHWRENCLLNDGSILTGKSLWTLEFLREIEQYALNQADAGEGGFVEKLEANWTRRLPR